MDRKNEMLDMIKNFNTMVNDVRQATEDNNIEIQNSLPARYEECRQKFNDYFDIYKALNSGTTMTLYLYRADPRNHGVTFIINDSHYYIMFKDKNNLHDIRWQIIPNNIDEDLILVMENMLNNNEAFAEFEKQFFDKLKLLMERISQDVDDEYQQSVKRKNILVK